ncbi:MAG: hypothetical protein HYU97_05960 [Deltaproteobacteria bacterium]|nr:hypothetical protein [Deltaproteobacteria bacterium]
MNEQFETITDLEKQFEITWAYLASELYEFLVPLSEARAPDTLPFEEGLQSILLHIKILENIFSELDRELNALGNSSVVDWQPAHEKRNEEIHLFKEIIRKLEMLKDQESLSSLAAETYLQYRQQIEQWQGNLTNKSSI